MAEPKVDLYAPFERDTILEVRASKMKKMRGLDVMSGIDKTIIDGPVYVGRTGLEGDESDPTFHGGIDKAVHGYCSSHYPSWALEHPSAASSFVPGGFGENLVTAFMNERNVCIGDTMLVGSPSSLSTSPDSCLLLEVSLPRQPCFKLNHRFQLKKFAPLTWKLSRTGWYYRVLRPGYVQAGNEIRLVSRPYPKWTIERIQEYLHRNQENEEMNAELAGIEELGAESRDAFKARVARAEAKKKRAEKLARWRNFAVVERKQETASGRIVSFVLEAVDPIIPPEGDEKSILLKPGVHARVKLGNGLVRAYSIVGPVDGASVNRFQLAIALEPNSRGGSKYLHSSVFEGHTLQVSANFTNALPQGASGAKAAGISHHIYVAGGVGLTAFLTSVEHFQSIHVSCELHYAVRSSSSDMPFRDRLSKLLPGTVKIYDKSQSQRLNIENIVKTLPWNTMLYFCGPKSLMSDAAEMVKKYEVPEGEVHFEAFEADISGDPFEVVVTNREGKTLKVEQEETLLEVLQREFGDEEVEGSCCVGNCGTCKVNLKKGRVEHRGTALTGEEKEKAMLACVSRGVGRIVIEI